MESDTQLTSITDNFLIWSILKLLTFFKDAMESSVLPRLRANVGPAGWMWRYLKISEDHSAIFWDVMGCHGMSWDIYLQILQINFFGENLPLNFNPAISPRRNVDAPIVTRMQHWLAGPRIVAKRISKPIPTPNKVWPFGLGNQFFELCLPIQENIF